MQNLARQTVTALGAVALLALFAFSSDPPERLVAHRSGTLLEPLVPGKFRPATFQCSVKLSTGNVVVATVPASLRSAPKGTRLSVSEYRTLLFHRTSYTADLATR
jgi:hypothetical protein